MSLPLKQVIKHLQMLRAKLVKLESQGNSRAVLEQRREIAEQYANVHPSIMAMPVGIIRRPVALFEEIKGEWFYQADVAETRNRLLYIHGGGGAHGRLSCRLNFAAKIAETTVTAVLALDYRQLPQYPYPASLADCLAAYVWLLTHGPDDNSSAQHTYVLGEAEGGTLALCTLQNIKRRDLKPPDAAVALSPLTDWSGASDSWTYLESVDPYLPRQFLFNYLDHFLSGIDDPKDPLASPLYGDLDGLPPLLLQVGGREILLDEATRFAEKVAIAKGRVQLEVFPDMPHAFQLFSPFLNEATGAIKHIADFIHSATLPPKSGEVIYLQPKIIKR